MARIRINKKPLPKAATGGLFSMPFAGVIGVSPFGLITSDTSTLDKNINDSVKPVKVNDANIEAEKGETLFKFDGGGIFKINGKKHSQGGTPLKVDNGDFIFSDDKDLAITPKEAYKFELNISKTKKNNTPARVLDREIDTKLYNKFSAILRDPKSTDIAKKTAMIMLQKYQDKIGQVAFLQESKKDFPEGLPSFAEGTAPVYSDELSHAKVEQKMYAKKGGFYSKKKMPIGGTYNDPFSDMIKALQNGQFGQDGDADIPPPITTYPGGKTKAGATTPTGKNNAFNYPGGINGYIQNWNKAGVNINSNSSNSTVQGKVYDYLLKNNPDAIKQMWSTYGNTNLGKKNGIGKGFDFNNLNSDQLSQLRGAYTDNLFGVRQLTPDMSGANVDPQGRHIFTTPASMRTTITPAQAVEGDQPQSPFQTVPTQPFKGYNLGMNSMEALSVASPFLTALAQPTYYDPLVQKHSPNVFLDRQNNKQELSDIAQQSSLATRSGYANAPYNVAQSIAANAVAQATGASGRSNAQVRAENTQIGNQESMTNYQTGLQDNDFNLHEIQGTFRNNILSQQRRDEQLQNGENESMNNMFAVQRNLDTINQRATAAVLPYLSNAYYDKNNNLIGQGDLNQLTPSQRQNVAYAKQMAPIAFGNNRVPFTTGFGSFNSIKSGNNFNSDIYQTSMTALQNAMKSGDPKVQAYAAGELIKMFKPNSKGDNSYEEIMSNILRGPQTGGN